MAKKKFVMNINGHSITLMYNGIKEDDMISITDIAKYKNPDYPADVIKNWLRLRSTIDYLGLWEITNNPNFVKNNFYEFKFASGSNSFVLSPKKWIHDTKAIGLVSKAGKGGGTIAHKDIAFEFASWISPEFKLYVFKEYQRLVNEEKGRLSLEWEEKRLFSKINYKFHTDAIKKYLITPDLEKYKVGFTYANEADLINIALFNMTAKEWRENNPNSNGNIRDFASYEELIVLANLESFNSEWIKEGIPANERLRRLSDIARSQMISLLDNKTIKNLKEKKELEK